MPELRTTFTLAPPSGWRLSPQHQRRWLAPAWSMLPLAPRLCRVRNPLNGSIAELSAEQYAVLSACEGCHTLAEHAATVQRKLGTRDDDRPAIDRWLRDFASTGLLIAFDDLVRRLEPVRESVPAAFGGVFIRTRDRPELLQRALQSAAALEARPSPRYAYRVLDDSRDEASRVANRRSIAESGLDCEYEDLSLDNALIVRLRTAFPSDTKTLDWLCGVARQGEATYGRPINIALLLSAGQRVLLLDDDALLTPRSPPLTPSGFGISSAADELFCFHGRAELEEQCPPIDLDPVASHLDCLGRPVRVLYDRFVGGAAEQLSVVQLDREDATRFDPEATVRLTQNQALGDPGSSLFPYHLLTLTPRSREQIERNPKWRDYAFSERCNWRGQTHARLAPGRSMTLTTLSGLDNGSILPPTVRAHRNEDLLLGEMTRRIDPGAWLFDLPWALPHFRSPVKAWLNARVSFPQEPVHFLLDYVDTRGPSLVSAAAGDRLIALGALLEDLAATSDAQLTDMLEQHAADAASRTRFQVATQLEDPSVSSAWKAMLQTWLASPTLSVAPEVLRARLVATDTIRDIARQYGRALAVWPSVWQWAKDRNGGDLMR